MIRDYKTFRFSYDAKWLLDTLIADYEEHLYKRIQSENLYDVITDTIIEKFDLNGVSVNLDLKISAGSIIELAIQSTDSLDLDNTLEHWHALEKEAEAFKKEIPECPKSDSVPRVYMSKDAITKLEGLRFKLREDSPRGPKLPYIVKIALFNLYKQTIS